jgi:hypothetical protein
LHLVLHICVIADCVTNLRQTLPNATINTRIRDAADIN